MKQIAIYILLTCQGVFEVLQKIEELLVHRALVDTIKYDDRNGNKLPCYICYIPDFFSIIV